MRHEDLGIPTSQAVGLAVAVKYGEASSATEILQKTKVQECYKIMLQNSVEISTRYGNWIW